MSDMFHKFDNLPDGYVPNNEPARRCCSDNNFIITGQSVSHSFSVPFNAETDLADYEIIYKTGVDIMLRRSKNDLETIVKDDGSSVITCYLSSDDSKKFDNTILDTFAQLMLVMLDGTSSYSAVYRIMVINSLEFTQPYTREGEKKNGNA